MQSFLEIVAGHLNQQFGAKLYKLAVVFPNRRQGVYFLHLIDGEGNKVVKKVVKE